MEDGSPPFALSPSWTSYATPEEEALQKAPITTRYFFSESLCHFCISSFEVDIKSNDYSDWFRSTLCNMSVNLHRMWVLGFFGGGVFFHLVFPQLCPGALIISTDLDHYLCQGLTALSVNISMQTEVTLQPPTCVCGVTTYKIYGAGGRDFVSTVVKCTQRKRFWISL